MRYLGYPPENKYVYMFIRTVARDNETQLGVEMFYGSAAHFTIFKLHVARNKVVNINRSLRKIFWGMN